MSRETNSSAKEEIISGKGYDLNLIKRLFRYVLPYKSYLILSFLLLLVFTAINIYITVYLPKMLVDEYILTGTTSGLTLIILVAFGMICLSMLLEFFQFYMVNAMSQFVMYDLRKDLFAHVQKQSLTFFNKRPVGSIMTRLTSDVEALDQMFANCIVFTFNDILIITGLLGVMLWMSPLLTLITLAVIPCMLVASLIFQWSIRHSFRDVRRLQSYMNGFLQENITGMETVQIFNREKKNYDKFNTLNHDFYKANMRSVRSFAIFLPVIEILSSLAIILLLWFSGAWMLAEPNNITFGTITAFLVATRNFVNPIRDLADKFNILQTAMTSAERVFQLLDTDESLPEPQRPAALDMKGTVEFRNVWFAYNDEDWILKDVSFTVPQGKKIAIVGATGSGKSTIINLLFRFYDVQKGDVIVDGVNVKDVNLKDLRSNIGLVLQDVFLFSGNVTDNIRLSHPELTREHVIEAAKAVQAHPFIEKLPGGYDAEVKERGSTLSVGQRQLLSFARALAIDPQILILDEATSSVDSETEVQIQHALDKLLEGRTSIIVAHRLSTIQKADTILVIHKGEIVEQGSHQELLSQKGVYHRLYQLQYKESQPDMESITA